MTFDTLYYVLEVCSLLHMEINMEGYIMHT